MGVLFGQGKGLCDAADESGFAKHLDGLMCRNWDGDITYKDCPEELDAGFATHTLPAAEDCAAFKNVLSKQGCPYIPAPQTTPAPIATPLSVEEMKQKRGSLREQRNELPKRKENPSCSQKKSRHQIQMEINELTIEIKNSRNLELVQKIQDLDC